MFFVSKGEEKLNRRVIHQSNFIVPGDFYSLNNANKTYRSLNSLRLFKIINIQYSELDSTHVDSLGYAQLDCHIQLTKYYLQSYTVELQGTNSYGNIGAGGSFLYQHRSLFGGAEITDFKINGSIETIDEQSLGGNDYTTELGGNITISIPKFILPILKLKNLVKNLLPKLKFQLDIIFKIELSINDQLLIFLMDIIGMVTGI